MDIKKNLAAHVREMRISRKWSQITLAKRAGVAQSTISRIEAGDSAAADVETIGKIADALGVPAWQLLADVGVRILNATEAAIFDAVKKLASQ